MRVSSLADRRRCVATAANHDLARFECLFPMFMLPHGGFENSAAAGGGRGTVGLHT